jgi:hypothetical protein
MPLAHFDLVARKRSLLFALSVELLTDSRIICSAAPVIAPGTLPSGSDSVFSAAISLI